MTTRDDVCIIGVGMHPWGKWGRPFVEYGGRRRPGRAGRRRTRLDRRRSCVVGGETVRNGYPGYVAGATFAQALGWQGARVATVYAACAIGRPRARHGADPDPRRPRATSRWWWAPTPRPRASSPPTAGERWDDPDWLRFRLLGATNPTYFGLYARRRMDAATAPPSTTSPWSR